MTDSKTDLKSFPAAATLIRAFSRLYTIRFCTTDFVQGDNRPNPRMLTQVWSVSRGATFSFDSSLSTYQKSRPLLLPKCDLAAPKKETLQVALIQCAFCQAFSYHLVLKPCVDESRRRSQTD